MTQHRNPTDTDDVLGIQQSIKYRLAPNGADIWWGEVEEIHELQIATLAGTEEFATPGEAWRALMQFLARLNRGNV